MKSEREAPCDGTEGTVFGSNRPDVYVLLSVNLRDQRTLRKQSERTPNLPAGSDRARDICTFIVARLVLFEVRSGLV